MPSPSYPFVHLQRAHDWQDRPEFAALCEWWRTNRLGVCGLVGIGGAGKTAIAERFLQVLPSGFPENPKVAKDRTLRAPQRLFVFSFYEAPNPEYFFGELAAWLSGSPSPGATGTSPHGNTFETCMRLLRSSGECLLVLDGLEKIQADGRRDVPIGHIDDDDLRMLVLDAADARLPGVVIIITSRFRLFNPLEERSDFYHEITVDRLSTPAAVQLLRERGVRGTDGELEMIALEQGLHALTIDLVGGFIAYFCGGDLQRFSSVSSETIDASSADVRTLSPRAAAIRDQERRLARIARQYERGLAHSDPTALAVLQRLCIFPLGIDAVTFAVIFLGRKKESISGASLAKLSERELHARLSLLLEMRLVETTNVTALRLTPGGDRRPAYVIHPAVRDGFLQGLDATTARRINDAARKQFEASLGDRPGVGVPTDPAVLDVLEQIVYLALGAGAVSEAWSIYESRMGRGENLLWRLAAYGRHQRLCRAFLDDRPGANDTSSKLPPYDHMVWVNEWGVVLMSRGHLDHAIRCFEEFFAVSTRLQSQSNTVRAQHNLVQALLMKGALRAAKGAVLRALELAKSYSDEKEVVYSHSYALGVYSLTGKIAETFEAYDRVKRHDDPEVRSDASAGPRGAYYATFLRRIGRFEEARACAERHGAHGAMMSSDAWEYTHYYTLVQAEVALEKGDHAAARELIAAAASWAHLRHARELLCWAELVRARLHQAMSAAAATRNDRDAHLLAARGAINAGLQVARSYGYGIYHIELKLTAARVALSEGRVEDAQRDLLIALDDGSLPPAESSLPVLLAANDPECGYVWGIAEGRHLTAEALLLEAAQKLGSSKYEPAQLAALPRVRKLIDRARTELNAALDLWRTLTDPTHPHRRTTQRVLDDLASGWLTGYPLDASESPGTRTVVELDLFKYGRTVKPLEEELGSIASKTVNQQVQLLVDEGLDAIGVARADAVVKTMGDAAILVFDEPPRAHEFAQAFQDASRSYNRARGAGRGKRLFRIGVATGQVDIYMTPEGRDIAGNAVVHAKRLEAAASPGEVLCDLETARRLRPEQIALFGPIESVAGKEGRYEARRCVLNPDAAKDAEAYLQPPC